MTRKPGTHRGLSAKYTETVANDWCRVPIGNYYHLNISHKTRHNTFSAAIPEIENPFKILSEPFPTSTKKPWWKLW